MYDVVLLPEPALASKAIETSQSLGQLGAYFTLKLGEYFPHTSLYMLQLDDQGLERAKHIVERVASSTRRLTLEAQGYMFGEGYVGVDYLRTADTDNLQAQVIETLNPLRDGMFEADRQRMEAAAGVELENYQKYGYKHVGELFRPHITLSRLVKPQPDVVEFLPDYSQFNGTFDRLGIYEMSDHGTCVRKVVEFTLAQALDN